MAVGRDTVVAIALAGTTIDVSNSDDAMYPAYSFVPDPSQLLDTENHVWANYALAAYKGVHDFLAVNPGADTDISRSFPGIKVGYPPPPPSLRAVHAVKSVFLVTDTDHSCFAGLVTPSQRPTAAGGLRAQRDVVAVRVAADSRDGAARQRAVE